MPPESWDERPRALPVFSGRSRPGDLAAYLHKTCWIVVAIDLEADIATDMLADSTWDMVQEDLKLDAFDAVGIATPCGTFSPLRESPPGPRPLRSLERALWDCRGNSSLRPNGSSFCKAIAFWRSVPKPSSSRKGVWWENPDHGDKLEMWKTPFAETALKRPQVELAKFDQCRSGAETTKPTTS